MTKKMLVPGVVAAVTVATVVAAASGSAQTGGARTITLFEDVSRESSAIVDNIPRSPARDPEDRRFRLSTGDEIVARTSLLDRKGGTRLGTSYAHAVVVSGTSFARASLHAQVLLTLRDGTIALTGIAGAAQKPFAVTGGTGAYDGARGTATERETGSGAQLTIRLLS